MALGSARRCVKTCVDDTVKFIAVCEIIASLAALVFGVKLILETESSFDVRQNWFVYAVTLYGVLMFSSGILGMLGCLDFHAFLVCLVLFIEANFMFLYFADRDALEKLDTHLSNLVLFFEKNQVGFVAISATVIGIQAVGFFLAWSVRICSGGSRTDTYTEIEDYEYAPLYGTPSSRSIRQKFRETFQQPLIDPDEVPTAGPPPVNGV